MLARITRRLIPEDLKKINNFFIKGITQLRDVKHFSN